MQLRGGDFTRVNGRETLVTPGGDVLTVGNRNGALAMIAAPGARIEVRNDKTGAYERVAKLPGSFG